MPKNTGSLVAIIILVILVLSTKDAEPFNWSFGGQCIEITCHRRWGGMGPDTVVVKGTKIGVKCASIDYDDQPPTCDGYRPYGGDWPATVSRYGIEADDDYSNCWCSKRGPLFIGDDLDTPEESVTLSEELPKLKVTP